MIAEDFARFPNEKRRDTVFYNLSNDSIDYHRYDKYNGQSRLNNFDTSVNLQTSYLVYNSLRS